jgi:hypothetical protein
MRLRLWGAIHLVRPAWSGPYDEVDEAVVESYEKVQGFFDVAAELWDLAGDHERAGEIRKLVDEAYEREPSFMDDSQVDELLQLLEGIEDALVGTVVDDRWQVRVEQLPELRRRTRHLDLDESRGELAAAGVGEGIGHAVSLRNILLRARALGLWICLG